MIIGLARAIGETAPIITIGALTFIAFLPPAPIVDHFPFLSFEWLESPFTVMPIQMFNWLSRPQAPFQVNAAAAGVLVRFVLKQYLGSPLYLGTNADEDPLPIPTAVLEKEQGQHPA